MSRPFPHRPRFVLLLLAMLLAFILFIRDGFLKDAVPPPYRSGEAREILGQEERCLDCHGAMAGFAPAHNPQSIGCSPCHMGNLRAVEKEDAHQQMVLVPGNLADVYFTCGTANCHADIAHRVENSLMASMAGVVTVNRFVFGEIDTLSAWVHVQQLSQASPADTHLRQLCASCHLGNTKERAAPVTESSRGGGCIACHSHYSAEASAALAEHRSNRRSSGPAIHPAINLQVSNDHCFGCHSRSGRISTNYEGWHETKLSAEEVAGKPGYRLLADERVFEFIAEDVHHAQGLECIDCHSNKELMGDGQHYFHEEQAVKVQCGDCHFNGQPNIVPFAELDMETQKILSLRPWGGPRDSLIVGHWGRPMANVQWKNDQPLMISKNSGTRHPLSPPADICTRGSAHDALSCSACHTGWAPQCVGCHTAYEPEVTGYDLLAQKQVEGKWEEYLGEFFPEPPSLGVLQEMDVDGNEIRKVKAFIPGMIMTLNASSFAGRTGEEPDIFHRLFAPVAPHTTTQEGRSCRSCHNNPLALGYGRGVLRFENRRWNFYPEYVASPEDGLPQDAWIGFLQKPEGVTTTRPNARPFRIAEQQRILTVGACLNCHEEGSKVMLDGLDDFEGVVKRRSGKCEVPVWE